MNDRVALETRAGQRVLVTGGAGFLGSYVCERRSWRARPSRASTAC